LSPVLAANLGILTTVLFWGSQIPTLSLLLERYDPFVLAAARYAVAVPVLWLILRAREPGPLFPPGAPLGRIALLGGVGMAGFTLLYSIGLAHSDPVTAAVFAAATPPIASVVAWALEGQGLTGRIAGAIVFAVAGGVLATVDLEALGGHAFAFRGGEPLLVMAIVFWCAYSILAQRWLSGYSQLRITAITLAAAAPSLFAAYAAAAATGLAPTPPPAPRALDVALVVWIGVAVVCAGILLWNAAVKRLGVVATSLYLNLIPVVAIVLSMVVGYQPRTTQWLGAALVIAGVLQAQWSQIRAQRRRS
jgi:drug/metabolite transporter (DMT)-like permease